MEDSIPRSEPTPLSEKVWFSQADVAKYLGMGKTLAGQIIRSGEIPSAKVGRLRRVRRSDVDIYMQARLENGEVR